MRLAEQTVSGIEAKKLGIALLWPILLTIGIPSADAEHPGPSACGVERWRVKILADESRQRVNWSPDTSSIASLRRIPAPSELPATRRIEPQELTLYRVRAVIRQ